MHLPELNTQTEALVDQFPMFSQDGFMAYVIVIKEHYHMCEDGSLGRDPAPEIRPAPLPWPDDAHGTSVMFPGDVVFRKPSTDVVVAGSAVVPGDVPSPTLDVMVRVGVIERSLRAVGPRTWYRGGASYQLSPPSPFRSCPLRWEEAFGGTDLSNPEHPAIEWRNPSGRGMACDPSTLEGVAGPRIEDPTDPITSHRDRPRPVGIAAVGAHFEPRRRYAGTFDDAWMTGRMPLLPVDFDERYYQMAPPEMIAPEYLRGGEPIQLLNIGRPGIQQYFVPRRVFGVRAHVGRSRIVDYHVPFDTLLIRADDHVLELTWRVPVVAPAITSQLRAIDVYEKRMLA